MEPSYIGRIERGRENTTIETLDALATILNEPVAAFFVVPAEGAKRPAALKPGRKRQMRPAQTDEPA
jgi:transcriptional regulator with XRE-family HTH domain